MEPCLLPRNICKYRNRCKGSLRLSLYIKCTGCVVCDKILLKKIIGCLENSGKRGVEYAVFCGYDTKQNELLIRDFFVYHHFYLPLYESTCDIVQCSTCNNQTRD